MTVEATQTDAPRVREAPLGGELVAVGGEGVSIVIPAYNEEEGIGRVLEELTAELRELAMRHIPLPLPSLLTRWTKPTSMVG